MEKQIEEMKKDLIEIFDEEYEKRRLITPQNTAEKMTAKGYRKQSEGEWGFVDKEAFWICNIEESLKTGKPTKELMPVCSVCKTLFGKIVLEFKFCPECGAKMLKGE